MFFYICAYCDGATYANAGNVQTSALLSGAVLTLSAPRMANKVKITMTNNANSRGVKGTGGDQVGLGEIRFIAK